VNDRQLGLLCVEIMNNVVAVQLELAGARPKFWVAWEEQVPEALADRIGRLASFLSHLASN
jgi:hypothetical protein